MVLRTSVGYNTQKASLPLNDEQRQQADRLGQEAQQAGRAGKYGEALRLYQPGTAVMRNVLWTPAVEFAFSLQGRLDHALLDPGSRATLSLVPLYVREGAPAVKMTASASLLPVGTGPTAKDLLAATPVELPFKVRIPVPEAPAGDYIVEVRFTTADGESPGGVLNASVKRIPVHIEALSADDHAPHVVRAGSESHTNPNLLSALLNRIRHQTIQADRS